MDGTGGGGFFPAALPAGFHFHPTDEELVVQYLMRKVAAAPLPADIIADVNIYNFDPWELPGQALYGENVWYFFTPRERKYPNGARPKRGAISGYWKATGTDKPIMAEGGTSRVGVKKALVFYRGKPPKGLKTNWIMHEYRLVDNKPGPIPDFINRRESPTLDEWVLCRIYEKRAAPRPDQEYRDTPTPISDGGEGMFPAVLGDSPAASTSYSSYYGHTDRRIIPAAAEEEENLVGDAMVFGHQQGFIHHHGGMNYWWQT